MSGPDFLDDLDFEDLMGTCPVYEARGDTYRLREEFISWGWCWVASRKSWQLQTRDEHDPCLEWARRQPGVVVSRRH